MSTTTLNAPETDVIGYDQFNPADNADSSALKFINFYLANPGDAMSKAFTTVITSKSGTLAADVAAFFSAYPAYSACTLNSYLAGLIYQAQHPDSTVKPANEKTYSLNTFINLLGGKWPDGMPDIAIAEPSCSFSDGTLDISFELDFTTLSFENDIIAANVKKLITQTRLQASLTCNFQPTLNIFESKISIRFDDIKLPVSSSDSLTVTAPTVSLNFKQQFKYVVFTLSGAIPATVFNTPINVDLSLVIDNDEANIGASIVGANASLPAPPGVKGLHFDEIGVGMGLFFEPPGLAFGLEGKFHIGDAANNIVDLDDDTFALVCEYVEEAIAPKYVGFYVPKLSLNEVMEIFTDANPNIDVPVNFTDLSFHWSTGPIALPDGTLSPSGYGFSAAVDIFSFGFFGQMNFNKTAGLSANVELSPLALGKVFKLTGDGKGYSIKVDENGNPIKNNFVPKTQAEIDAVSKATDKQLISPGGACLIINTLSMPILHLNAKASLFDLLDCDITADINKDGIRFELDYGAVLTQKMVCNLTDFQNLYAEFGYHIDKSIPLPTIAGVNPGSIPLKADASLHLAIKTLSDVAISTGGNFDFEGYHFNFGDFTADINITKISDLVAAIVQYIKDHAKTVFNQLVDTAEHWAAAAGKGIVTGFDDAGKVMKNAFGKTEQEMTAILKGAGFAANDIAKGLKDGYGKASQEVAALMKDAGYDVAIIGNAIKNAWNCGVDDVSWALHEVGFGAQEVANALVSAFGSITAQEAINSLKKWGYDVVDIANVIKSDLFKGDSIAVAAIMKAADYAIIDIAKGIKGAWNCAETDVAYALKAAGVAAYQIASAISNAWDYFANTAGKRVDELIPIMENAVTKIANALQQVGYLADEAAGALKNGLSAAINFVAYGMKQVGYATKEVASALQTAFNTSVDVVAGAMKEAGYAADDVKNAFESLGGDFKSFADTAWNDVKNAFNPSNW